MKNAPYTFMLTGALVVLASWIVAVLIVLLGYTPAEAKDKAKKPKTEFVLRSNTKVLLLGNPLLLTAEITGDAEPEEWYCPEITWFWPNGTISIEEPDCPPYEQRTEYPRRWSRWVTPGWSAEEPIPFSVQLRVGAKRVRAHAEVLVRGGE